MAFGAATAIPLILTLVFWRFEYSDSSTKALGLAQVRTALDGSQQLLALYSPPGTPGFDKASFSSLKRMLNGPIVKILLGPSDAGQAGRALSGLGFDVRLVEAGESMPGGDTVPADRTPDGGWSISDESWVGRLAEAWDALDETGRRSLANQTLYIRVLRDSSRAVIRVGESGYIWALSALRGSSGPCWEFFHPQIEAIEGTFLVNARGERIGNEIATMNGRIDSAIDGRTLRYDYYWKNPSDQADRKKIVLMRYIDSWDIVLCAGLYEDEYYLPVRSAESMFVVLVLLIGGITLLLSFAVAYRIGSALESLSCFSRLTAEADGAVHALQPTGISEIDSLSRSLSEMEQKILDRERALQKELLEKDVLIEEVHHRVKNNLAVLSSIINLQKTQAAGEEAERVLDILYGRVNSMAFVYQQLLGSTEYTRLPFDDFVRGIILYHQSSRKTSPLHRIERFERLDPVTLDLTTAVPFGLIVHEIVSNAYIHGAPEQGSSIIAIDLDACNGDITFSCTDNGRGVLPENRDGTGFLLIRALCSQLGATLAVQSPLDGSGGTCVKVSVPVLCTGAKR